MQYVMVARTGDVEPGTGKTVEVNGMPVALFNVNGVYHAIHNVIVGAGFGDLATVRWRRATSRARSATPSAVSATPRSCSPTLTKSIPPAVWSAATTGWQVDLQVQLQPPRLQLGEPFLPDTPLAVGHHVARAPGVSVSATWPCTDAAANPASAGVASAKVSAAVGSDGSLPWRRSRRCTPGMTAASTTT